MSKTLFKLIIILSIIFLFCNQVFASSYDNKILVVAGDNNYPPYEFLDKDGNFRGFNVDIMRALSIELGIDIQLVPSDWEIAIMMLKNGNVDALQGMTITDERSKNFLFTQPIVSNSQSVFVLTPTSNISELRDLTGKKIAIQSDDVSRELISGIPNLEIIEKKNQQESFRALIQGEVDAYVGNRLTGMYFVQNYDLTESVKMVGDTIFTNDYAIAFKKGNQELLKLFDSGISAIKENGTYDKIYSKWFGESISKYNKIVRDLLYASIVGLILSCIVILLIFIWNKKLKEEVENRTLEIIELNKIAIHNNKMQAIGRLSAGIAHEIRNPLTSVKAFIDLIPYKIDDENFKKELISIVPKELKRMDDLVVSLLDYSKPMASTPIKITLKEILYETITLLNKNIKDKNIKISVNENSICFYADYSQTKQILLNIILNCIDAVDYGGKIHIQADSMGEKVRIVITDDGPGMDNETLTKLFEPFYTSKKSGYGIGLSIVDRLVKENNGLVVVDSEVGCGTNVSLYFPALEYGQFKEDSYE